MGFPGGHFSTFKNASGGWVIFYPNFESHRTAGNKPFPEDPSTKLDQGGQEYVIGGRHRPNPPAYNNHGMWLKSAHLTSNDGDMIGFAQAEQDNGYPNGT